MNFEIQNENDNPTENKPIPFPAALLKDPPKETIEQKEIPVPSELHKKLPDDFDKQNSVLLGDRWIEIKPTKLKYFRNRTASIYSVLKVVPLTDFLAYDKGVFDKKRDSDQILFDFLIAVFDNAQLVKTYYDELSSEDIERILQIFGRVNHIDEKEEAARKNRETQAQTQGKR